MALKSYDIVYGVNTSEAKARHKEIEKIVQRYRPKVIRTYEEGGVTVKVYETREGEL